MKKHAVLVTLISFFVTLTFATSATLAEGSSQTNTANHQAQVQSSSTISNSVTPLDKTTRKQIEATLNHNEGNVLSEDDNLATNWSKRVTVSGELNIDGKWRTTHGPTGSAFNPRDPTIITPSLFQTGHYNDIYLNNSQLDIDARVNNWTQAHISLTGRDPIAVNHFYRTDIYDNAPVNLDEAYITIGDFDKSPLYTTLGRQYIPFGVYDRHPIEPTLTQYLTQTQATAAKVGFALPSGMYGSVYTFRGQSFQLLDSAFSGFNFHINNFGGELGLRNASTIANLPLNYQLSVGYLEDLGDTDWIASVVGGGPVGASTGSHDVPGISIDGKMSVGDFAWHGSYVQALSHFQTDDVTFIVFSPLLEEINNARPWAFVFSGDYNFLVLGHNSTFSLNYQQSGDLQTLGIPRTRYGGSYTIALLKDTHLTFDIFDDHNSAEKIINFDGSDFTSLSAIQADLRLSVDF